MLDGAYAEVAQTLQQIPETKRNVDWKILNTYATKDAGTLSANDGPWAIMALLWCDRLDTHELFKSDLDPYQISLTGLCRSQSYGND